MKIKQSNFFDFLNKYVDDDKVLEPTFIIPIYQRPYQWNTDNCRILIEDLIEVGRKPDGSTHFTGSLLVEPFLKDDKNISIDIIDGQQRLITFALLIKAVLLLANEYKLEDEKVKTLSSLLSPDNFQRKIKPGEKDESEFSSLVDIKKFDLYTGKKNTNMYSNFEMMYSYLNSPETIYFAFDGLKRMTIVLLEVEKGKNDDAQEIFERMNSTGKPLSNADLIRNYLLMGTTDQLRQTRYSYWKAIEDNLKTSDDSKENGKNLEKFFFDFTRMKKGTSVDMSKIYYVFKDYVVDSAKRNGLDIETQKNSLLKNELKMYSEFYKDFIGEDKDVTPTTYKHQLYEMRLMKHTTPNPFLLRVYYDNKAFGIPNDVDFAKIVNLINIYLVRRALSKVPTSSLSNFFVTLYKNIFEFNEKFNYKTTSDKYYGAVYSYILRATGRDAMPDDQSVIRLGIDTKVFGNDIALALLQSIEFGRFNKVNRPEVAQKLLDPTIEHIMPQNIVNSVEWKEMIAAGDQTKALSIHAMYVNTIGNLSLSKQDKNSSMSNIPFEKKKEILRKYSTADSFEFLNSFVDEYDVFNETNIKDRANKLLKRVIEQYPLDNKVKPDDYKFGDTSYYTIRNISAANPNFFKSTNLIEYSFLDETKKCGDFGKLLVEVIKELYKFKQAEFLRVLNNPESETMKFDKPKLAIGNPGEDGFSNVVDNIFVLKKCYSNNVVRFLIKLISECGVDPDKLQVTIRKFDTKATCHLLSSYEQYQYIINNVLKPLHENGSLIYFPEITNKEGTSWPKFYTNKMLTLIPDDDKVHTHDGKSTNHQGILYFEGREGKYAPTIGLFLHSRKKDSELYKKFLPLCPAGGSYLNLFETDFEWNLEDDLSIVRDRFMKVVHDIESKVEYAMDNIDEIVQQIEPDDSSVSEEEYLDKKASFEEMVALYAALKEEVRKAVPNLAIRCTKNYIAFFDNKSYAEIHVHKDKLKIYVKDCGVKSDIASLIPESYNWPLRLMVILEKPSDLAEGVRLILASRDSVLN